MPILPNVGQGYVYDAKAQRIQQLYQFINAAGGSGYVDLRVIYRELARLLDLPEGAVV